jgi:hypothetical protein
MFVQATLLHRKGIGSFDPVSDGFLVFHDDPEDAWYYTWRKEREPFPQSSTLAGVFLGDHYDNFSFMGTRNSGSLGYLKSVFPKLKEGYAHSEFHRLFQAPADLQGLIDKVTDINRLYFGAEDDFAAVPAYSKTQGFSWELDKEKGIVEIHCSEDLSGDLLSSKFYEIVKVVDPCKFHVDPRIFAKENPRAWLGRLR